MLAKGIEYESLNIKYFLFFDWVQAIFLNFTTYLFYWKSLNFKITVSLQKNLNLKNICLKYVSCGAEGIEIELFSAGFGKNQQKSILK